MWFLAGLLLYGSHRPKTGNNAGGTLLLVLVGIVWVVAAAVELWPW